MNRRLERLNSLFTQLAAEFFAKELPLANSVFVTVTRADISSDLKNATIYISVFPEEKEKEIMKAVKDKRVDLRKYFAGKLTMKFLPVFKIEIDEAEKARLRFEESLKKSND